MDFPYEDIEVVYTSSSVSTPESLKWGISSGEKLQADYSFFSFSGNVVFLTNDDPLRKNLIKANKIVLGSAAILSFAIDKGLITLFEATEKHNEMKKLGFRVLDRDFRDYFKDRERDTYQRICETLKYKF